MVFQQVKNKNLLAHPPDHYCLHTALACHQALRRATGYSSFRWILIIFQAKVKRKHTDRFSFLRQVQTWIWIQMLPYKFTWSKAFVALLRVDDTGSAPSTRSLFTS